MLLDADVDLAPLALHQLLGEGNEVGADQLAQHRIGGRIIGKGIAEDHALVLVAADVATPVPELTLVGLVEMDLGVVFGERREHHRVAVGRGGEARQVAAITRQVPPAMQGPDGFGELGLRIGRAGAHEAQGLGGEVGAGPDRRVALATVALHALEAGVGEDSPHDAAGRHHLLAQPRQIDAGAIVQVAGTVVDGGHPSPDVAVPKSTSGVALSLPNLACIDA